MRRAPDRASQHATGRRSRHPDRRQTACRPTRGDFVTLNGGSVSVSGYQSFDLIANGTGTQIQADEPQRKLLGQQLDRRAGRHRLVAHLCPAARSRRSAHRGSSVSLSGTNISKRTATAAGRSTSPMAHRSSATGSRSPSTERPILRRATTPSSRSMRAALDRTRCNYRTRSCLLRAPSIWASRHQVWESPF